MFALVDSNNNSSNNSSNISSNNNNAIGHDEQQRRIIEWSYAVEDCFKRIIITITTKLVTIKAQQHNFQLPSNVIYKTLLTLHSRDSI